MIQNGNVRVPLSILERPSYPKKSQNAVNVITSFKNKKSMLFYEISIRFEYKRLERR